MTTILEAITQPTLTRAAFSLVSAGCSILPTRGKRPAIKNWQYLNQQLPPMQRVQHWINYRILCGIGLICGEVSGNLAVLDVDSMDACTEFEAAFPRLADTLTVRSGSGRGRHYYFYSDILPANAWLAGVELRTSGAYVIAPPTIHPCGNPYVVENAVNPRRVANLDTLREWVVERAARIEPAPRPNRNAIFTAIRSGSAYGRAALTSECIAVRMAPVGSRNKTLYIAALKAGSLISSGHLERLEVESQLESAAAALVEDDGQRAVQKTIKSGIEKGLANGNTRRVG